MKRFLIVTLVLGLVLGGLGIGVREVLGCDAVKDYICSSNYHPASKCCYSCGFGCRLPNGEWGTAPYDGCTGFWGACQPFWEYPCSAFC